MINTEELNTMASFPPVAFPPVSAIFQYVLPPATQTAINSSHYDALVREKLEIAEQSHAASQMQMQTPVSPRPTSEAGQLLTDLGDYFSKTAIFYEQVVESMLRDARVNHAGRKIIEESQRNSNIGDLSAVNALDEDMTRLIKIRDLTSNYSREVQETWRPSMRTDESSVRLPPIMTKFDDIKKISQLQPRMKHRESVSNVRRAPSTKVKQIKQDHASPEEDDSGSDVSEDDEEIFAKLDMDSLKSRGKGNHVCPKGQRCTKGGIDKDGHLIIFDRNSSFVQHCNKHRKPYRCTLEGCPNQPKKRKFARRDGLERHQRSVPHLTTPL